MMMMMKIYWYKRAQASARQTHIRICSAFHLRFTSIRPGIWISSFHVGANDNQTPAHAHSLMTASKRDHWEILPHFLWLLLRRSLCYNCSKICEWWAWFSSNSCYIPFTYISVAAYGIFHFRVCAIRKHIRFWLKYPFARAEQMHFVSILYVIEWWHSFHRYRPSQGICCAPRKVTETHAMDMVLAVYPLDGTQWQPHCRW